MFKFNKIASILASTLMIGSTIGLAAVSAASYPAPFVTGGSADVALVWGTTAANTDLAAVVDITNSLNGYVTSNSVTTDSTVTGEAAPLFTGGTKIYVNDSLNAVKKVVTKSQLPTLLADGSFSGNVDTTFTQTVELGSVPVVSFKKQPTSSDDPQYGLEMSTSTNKYTYNATVIFNKAVMMNHSDSEGEDLTLFGSTFTIAAATSGTDLVLLKSAERVSLTNEDPSAEVVIGEETFTIELISTSDTAATIKVTDGSGASSSKEINEDASKKVQGVTVAVINADENNLLLSATLVVGSEKIKMVSGSTVKLGEDETSIKGTKVIFTGGTAAMTKLVVSVTAGKSDEDALLAGGSLADPVYGTFKLDFSGFNIPPGSSSREDILIEPTDDDQIQITFDNLDGDTATVVYGLNMTTGMELMHNDEGNNISVFEAEAVYYLDYLVIGNEDEARLVQITDAANESTTGGTTNDLATFTDVFSGDTYKTTWTSDGTGTVTIGGKSHDVTILGADTTAQEDFTIRVNQQDSTETTTAIAFPMIETSKGAKLAFYEPIRNISVLAWDGTNALTKLRIPDGDDYSDITISQNRDGENTLINITFPGGSATTLNTTVASTSVAGAIGQLTYNFSSPGTPGANVTTLHVVAPGGNNVDTPAIIILEEKDDNSQYHGMVVTTDAGATADSGIGVSDVVRTWELDNTAWESNKASDSKITAEGDLWGTIIETDKSDSDQYSALISYPDEQLFAELYVAEESASITAGGSTAGGGAANIVPLSDAEISSAAGMHLIVVGGSCINTVAADLLGVSSPTCGSDFTSSTDVGAGQFLIETYDRTGGKVATLVAGYNAGDTTNGAKFLTTQESVMTDAGDKYIGTSSSSAELVTATTTGDTDDADNADDTDDTA